LVFSSTLAPLHTGNRFRIGPLMTMLKGRLSACALFIQPTAFSEEWAKSDLGRKRSVFQAFNVLDRGGKEAQRFDLIRQDRFWFTRPTAAYGLSGGITPSRGHEGDNEGTSPHYFAHPDRSLGFDTSAVYDVHYRKRRSSMESVEHKPKTPNEQKIRERAEVLFQERHDQMVRRGDKILSNLMLFQWVLGVALAVVLSPYTWPRGGTRDSSACLPRDFLGGLLSTVPILVAKMSPGTALTAMSWQRTMLCRPC